VKTLQFIAIVIGLILASFLNTVDLKNFYFIQSTTYIQLAGAICFMFLAIASLSDFKKRGPFYRITIIDINLLLIGLLIVVSFSNSSTYTSLIDNLIMSGVWGMIYWYIRCSLINNPRKEVYYFFYILPIIGCVQIIYALLQYLGIKPELFYHRYGGSFGNSGDLANFLALTFSITLVLLFIEKNKQRKILLGIVLLFHLFLIVISLARTAWIAIVVSSIFILAINLKTAPLWLKIKSAFIEKKWLVPLILFFFIIILGLGGWKIYEFKSASANGRLFIWQLCLQLIGEKPIFGHGYESFITVLRQAQINYFSLHPNDLKNGMLAANSVFAFNDFLQFMVEYGIFGGLLLLSIFILPFKKIKFGGEHERKIITTVRGTFIALFACALFSYPLQNQTILILFVILLAIVSSYDQSVLFQFSLSPKVKIPLATLFLIGCISLAYFNYKKITYGLKWKQAYNLLQTDPKKAANIYNSIYDFMKHDQSFISNYGLSFYKNEEYQKLVDYYEKYDYFNPSTEIFLMSGESYEKLGNSLKAEEKYRMASNLIPHLFVPRYRLFKLYQKEGENEKALAEAKAISELPIKVYSDIVKNIKTEANEYLYNTSHIKAQ